MRNLIKPDLQKYIDPNCRRDWLSIGDNTNYICVNIKGLIDSVLKSKFYFYASQVTYLYINNFDSLLNPTLNSESLYIPLVTQENQIFTHLPVSFEKRYLRIIYTTDKINYGVYNICDLTDVLEKGCVINLTTTNSNVRQIVHLSPGNNNLLTLSQNINSYILNNGSCVNSIGTTVGCCGEYICVNSDKIFNFLLQPSETSTSSIWFYFVIIAIVLFVGFFVILVIVLYFYQSHQKKLKEEREMEDDDFEDYNESKYLGSEIRNEDEPLSSSIREEYEQAPDFGSNSNL